jgi:F420H(2)-dependent quinone reductase
MAADKARLPPRWFIETFWHAHRQIVRRSKGRKGLWSPRPGKCGALRLTTTGRRSGEPRSVILGYYEDGPNPVSMAIAELAGRSPREVLDRRAVGNERERLWQRCRPGDRFRVCRGRSRRLESPHPRRPEPTI